MSTARCGVLLVPWGATKPRDDLPAYLKTVGGGRPADEELITEFRRRYRLIGGSPLLSITREQAAALQKELNSQHPEGPAYHVIAGMRFAPPFIADLVPEIALGAQQLVGVIMSPQYSPIIMSGYVRTLQDAVEELHRDDLELKIAGYSHLHPLFLLALAERVQQALDRLTAEVRERVPALLTAPRRPDAA